MNRRQLLRLLGLSGLLVVGAPGVSRAASSDELARSAQDALESGDTDKALSLLDEAMTKDPRNDRVQALLGRTYFQRGDARTALAHFTLAVRLNPEDTLSRIMVETISQFPLPPGGDKPGDAPPRRAMATDKAAMAEREALSHPTAGGARSTPMRLLIDAGHGGMDVGAPGDGLRESDVTLDIALRLARILAASPQQVALSLTRTADVSLPDWARAALAGFYGADLLVSLHAARVPRPDAAGIAVYAYSPAKPSDALAGEVVRVEGRGQGRRPAEASRAGRDIFLAAARRAAGTGRMEAGKRLAGQLTAALRQGASPLPVAGGGSGPFPLLAASDAPAVLVETGFLSHPQDAAVLAVPEKRQAVADALARALLAVAGREKVGAP